jgi:hypothetical protein
MVTNVFEEFGAANSALKEKAACSTTMVATTRLLASQPRTLTSLNYLIIMPNDLKHYIKHFVNNLLYRS